MINKVFTIGSWLIAVIIFSCSNTEKSNQDSYSDIISPVETISGQGIKLDIYDFNALKPLLEQDNDTLYIINFWATWCKPCVRELPYFERIRNEYILFPVKVILVSLDFRPDLETQLIPFMIKHQIKSDMMVLNDPDANTWIEQVDANWSGAIPATLIFKGDNRWFYEQSFSFEELNDIVESKLKQK